MCCRAIKTKVIEGAVIAYQSLLSDLLRSKEWTYLPTDRIPQSLEWTRPSPQICKQIWPERSSWSGRGERGALRISCRPLTKLPRSCQTSRKCEKGKKLSAEESSSLFLNERRLRYFNLSISKYLIYFRRYATEQNQSKNGVRSRWDLTEIWALLRPNQRKPRTYFLKDRLYFNI